MKKILLFLLAISSPILSISQNSTTSQIDETFKAYTGWFVDAIFYEIPFSDTFQIPWVLIVLIGGAVFFTIYFKVGFLVFCKQNPHYLYVLKNFWLFHQQQLN